jgi:mono/diheme cytochrome c family protein
MRAFRVVSGLFLLLLPGITGCRATKPEKLEEESVYWIKRNITVGNKREANPIPMSSENIEEGKEAFESYCMVCHGLDAQNTGVPFAATMSPPVPSLANTEVQAYTDGQLKWIIENGIYPSGMPPSKGIFSDDDIWRMVLYIRHLPHPGSLGDPIVYGGNGK